ncbi:MAG: hypothetical protein N4A76_12025 [Firmicutes bacterium]|jgi:hypothetical protein|nr:hypothetical protein [Bacillota bacterium]
MSSYRIGRFSFGITLILAGLFSIMANMGMWESVPGLLKLWPFVLIVLGAEILFVIKKGYQGVKTDIGSIFMMIIVVLVAGTVNIGTMFLNSEYNEVLKNQIGLGQTVSRDYDYKVENTEIESIAIAGIESYQINFTEYDGEKIWIKGISSYSKTAGYDDKKDKRYLLDYDIEGKSLMVFSDFKLLYRNNHLNNQLLRVEVMIPKDMDLRILGDGNYEVEKYDELVSE